jgi:SAM-dependent methyltransferase
VNDTPKRQVPPIVSTVWKHSPAFVRDAALAVNRRRPGNRVRWGNMRRTRPFGIHYGYDRGTPVDRHYLESFLATHRARIAGRVLEVKDATYTRKFASGAVEPVVVDIDPDNPQADLVADLCVPGSLGDETFDCVIFTQTLQFLAEPGIALANLWAALRPGGALLVSAPAISPVDAWFENDYWRVTPAGLRRLVGVHCPGATTVEATGYGNCLAAVAAIHGLALQEVSVAEVDDLDPALPLLSTALVVK